MKHIAFMLLAWVGFQASQGTFVSKNARISLYSRAPLEDIDAVSTSGTSVLNATAGEVAFSVPIRSFKFEKSLMQEHFNENYMESDKYPNATFKGKIQQMPDLSKDGVYPVSATGVLEMHGVKQNRNIPGKITVNNGIPTLTTEFTVQCKDHKIDIPQIVFKKIAETITVKVTASYNPYKK